jgi:glutaredoxin 3
MELDTVSGASDIQRELGKITGATTVPRVFIGGECIGGGDETAALASSGELKKLLERVGADFA